MGIMRALRLGGAVVIAMLVLSSSASAGGGPYPLGGVAGTTHVSDSTGRFNYNALGHGHSIVARIATDGGEVVQQREFLDHWMLPAVTASGTAGGLSADGNRLVLIRPYAGPDHDQTQFLVLDARTLRVSSKIELDGIWSFDALSPDGGLMYLVQYRDFRNPLDYRVRQYDVRGDVLRGGAIVDLDEPEEKMTGVPVSRVTSPDGATVYTLYGGGEETFIHALHTEIGQADCIDLEMFGHGVDFYDLKLEIDPETGVVTVLRGKRPEAIVDPETLEVRDSPVSDVGGAIGSGGSEPPGPSTAGPWIAVGAIGAGLALAALVGVLAVRRRPRPLAS